ncbi:4-alpha-glucanotransferase, partial [Streptomyces sp. WAC 05379]
MTAQRSAEACAEGPEGSADLPSDALTRLAELHGVATSFQPSADRTVTASATALTRALAALDVDTSTPAAVAAALAARDRELRERLLPPTLVSWSGAEPEALAALPSGTRLRVETEQGETRTAADRLPPGVHRLTATTPDGRT